MGQQEHQPRRIAVIGGGIAGLAAAHRMVELDPRCSVTLLEAGPRPGGVLSTMHEDGFQVEQSADNFITTVPWGLNLCRRLGLEDQLVQTNPAYRRTFVVRRGRMHLLPDGFLMMAPTRLWPLAVTGILSPLGKIRAGIEYLIPPRRDEADESMAAFVRRRLGREAFDRLVEPLVGAVYAADMEKLSVLATLPRFREMERDHGSLIRAMRRQMKNRPRAGRESGARYSMFVTLRDGLSSLVERIVSRLPADTVQVNTAATRIERLGDGWRVWTEGRGERREGRGESNVVGAAVELPHQQELSHQHRPLSSLFPPPSSPLFFDALVLATPSPVTAKLLQPVDATLAARLASIDHSGTAIVSLGYESDRIGHPLDGMGVVVPAVERSPILACSFSSRKYPHRAPDGKELLRVFVGGARRPELAEMDDDHLLPLVLDELSRLLHIRGEPCFCRIAHWPTTMPQYHVGHKELVAEIEAHAAALPNLQLAGNAYRGVGIPDCVHGGESAAERILRKVACRRF
ncbi:MAG: protoporphyrinogen oxidase [Pirellulales bacterium]|nr:protoporphyrinogen oxidase [Pirellulales bacterium]